MPNPVRFTDEQMFALCEKLYARDGFVKWSDVGAALGVSRQAIQLRLRAAQRRGNLTEEQYNRWASITARRAVSRERRKQSQEEYNEQRRLTCELELTPENYRWLRAECVVRKSNTVDLINGLITREREKASEKPAT